MSAASAAYADVAPDVEVRWDERSLQAFADQPLDLLVEEYDLLVIDHPHIPHAAQSGMLAALDGTGHDERLAVLAGSSVGRSFESYAYAGRIWGLPTDAAAQVSVHRPDLLPEPPRTWSQVLELAREGAVVWPHKPVDAFSSLVTVAASHGEEALRSPGVFLSPEGLGTAMDILRDLATHVPAENAAWNPIQAADALSAGDRFTYAPLLFGYSNYGRAGFREHRLAYVDIPAGSAGVTGSLLGGAGVVVSADSGHLEHAIDHAFWLASDEVQAGVYYDGGGQPGIAAAWDDGRLNDDSLSFFRNTRKTLESAYLRPRSPDYVPLQDEASTLVSEALAGRWTDEQLRTRLDDATTKWLGTR